MFSDTQPLGKQLRTFGINWVEITRWVVLAFILIEIIFRPSFPFPLSLPVAQLAMGLLLAAVAILLIKRKEMRIVVYEQGIGVQKEGEERRWRWNDITDMKGTRYTHSLYGVIPLISYGSNHFYAGNEKAFSVGVLTAQASRLANLILMKMAERDVLRYKADYERGLTIDFGNIQLSARGFWHKKQWIEWSDVRSLRFEGASHWNDYLWTVKVELHSKKKPQTIGYVKGPVVYGLAALVDSVRGTDYLVRLRQEQLLGKKVELGSLKRIALLTLALVAIIGAVIGYAVLGRENMLRQEQAARDELITLFGPNANRLCQTLSYPSGKPLSNAVNRYLVINVNQSSIYRPFYDVLGVQERATSLENLTAVICLIEQQTLIEECIYEDRQSYYQDGVFRFRVNRYRNDLSADLLDLATGMVVERATLYGGEPPQCPDNARINEHDIIGPPPTIETFLEWFNAATQSAMM